jgi:hypothetical protein
MLRNFWPDIFRPPSSPSGVLGGSRWAKENLSVNIVLRGRRVISSSFAQGHALFYPEIIEASVVGAGIALAVPPFVSTRQFPPTSGGSWTRDLFFLVVVGLQIVTSIRRVE